MFIVLYFYIAYTLSAWHPLIVLWECRNAEAELKKEARPIAKITVAIKGISPLIMHAFPLVPVEGYEKLKPSEQAEISAYRHPDTKELYIPGVNIQRALVSAATYSKGKGRVSLAKQAAACLLVNPERVILHSSTSNGSGVKEYQLDSRPVVIAATKGRIVRHRPRLDDWKAQFEIEYDETLLSEKDVRAIVDNMGSRVGLLEFRPERKGPFGRCMVTTWQQQSQ